MQAYAPLWCKSNFSFLEGASDPAELVEEARHLDLRHLALTDRDGVYGIVQAHMAAREHGLHLIVGSEVTVAPEESLEWADDTTSWKPPARSSSSRRAADRDPTLRPWRELAAEHAGSTGPARAAAGPTSRAGDTTIVLLAQDREGYANLCRLISRGRRRRRCQPAELPTSVSDGSSRFPEKTFGRTRRRWFLWWMREETHRPYPVTGGGASHGRSSPPPPKESSDGMPDDVHPRVVRQLAALRRRKGPFLEAVAYGRVRDRDVVVGVVNEAFAELLEQARVSSWTELPTAKAWERSLEQRVRELAHNRAKRDHRRTKRTDLLDGTTIEQRLASAVEPEQEMVTLDTEIRKHLTPEQERLYDLLLQGGKEPGIADELEISERTVQRRKAEIRSLIEKLLGW